MKVHFGPAGNGNSFGKRKNTELPEYLRQFGLDAYEYQCGHGVRISEQTAAALGDRMKEAGVFLSVHSPYYISLSSVEKEKREKSVQYLLSTAKVAKAMGATRIVVHSGSCAKITRDQALTFAKETLLIAAAELRAAHLDDISLCPETMGKINQLGNLEEVIALCRVDDSFIPCIDFGHLNARTFGAIRTKEDYAQILDQMEQALGRERVRRFHSHFSRIAFTEPGGEKRHMTFADTEWGPEFSPLAELIAERDLAPTVICESAGTQAEDAGTMREIYLQKREELQKNGVKE